MNTSLTLKDLPAPPKNKVGWPWTEQTDPLPNYQHNDSEWPRISIVTPSYNQGQFLEKTIRSVLLQGYPNLEYIIIDGGSTDESIEIIKKYEHLLTYWVSEKDQGQCDAINKGFKRTNGEILAWLNSDDYYFKDALCRVAKYSWKEHIGAVVGIGYYVNMKGQKILLIEPKELTFQAFLDWINSSYFLQPSCFFTRKAWLECGPLDTNLNYCMDVKLWLDISKKYSFERINQALSCALAHKKSKTIGQGEYSQAETILLIFKYGGEDIAKKHLYDFMNTVKKYNKIKSFIYKITFNRIII
jgi:glycosyltransferase involved in cell wall biosynthesis